MFTDINWPNVIGLGVILFAALIAVLVWLVLELQKHRAVAQDVADKIPPASPVPEHPLNQYLQAVNLTELVHTAVAPHIEAIKKEIAASAEATMKTVGDIHTELQGNLGVAHDKLDELQQKLGEAKLPDTHLHVQSMNIVASPGRAGDSPATDTHKGPDAK